MPRLTGDDGPRAISVGCVLVSTIDTTEEEVGFFPPSVILLIDPPVPPPHSITKRTEERPMVSLESRPAFKGVANKRAFTCVRLLYINLYLVVAILFNLKRSRDDETGKYKKYARNSRSKGA